MNSPDRPGSSLLWEAPEAVGLWKMHADTGGADKDRMVTVCSWLLGFAAAVIGLAFAQGVNSTLVGEKVAFLILASLGIGLSIVSAFVTLIYGGYANRNWAKADQIARIYGWTHLDPSDEPWTEGQQKCRGRLGGWARRLSKPADTYSGLAPIFRVYFFLSIGSALAQIIVLITVLFQK